MLWKQEGIPHKGWTCVEMIDIGEDHESESRRDYYEKCEMCNHEGIRYVHIMNHQDYSEYLRVGSQCAEKMEDDYVNPQKREKNLQNKHNRRRNFLLKEWIEGTGTRKGQYLIYYKNCHITIMPSHFDSRLYGVQFRNYKKIYYYKNKKINSLHIAKLLAFDLLEDYISRSK